jgi:N-acetylneuraminic acid mutarotase
MQAWVLGGAGMKSSESFIYNRAKREWRAGPALPTPQAWGGSMSVGGQLYALSGGHKMQVRFQAHWRITSISHIIPRGLFPMYHP